jgi:hypothetical protein
MNSRADRIITLESLALAVIVLMAVVLRMTQLDWPPLAPVEAAAALDAARMTPDASALDSSSAPPRSAAYAAWTAVLFTAFGASDALARFAPALAGIALLGLPFLLRRSLGRGAGVIAALLMALSPALVMESRAAGGAALAMSAVVLAWGVLMRSDLDPRRRSGWIAALLGLGAAAGPACFTGLLGVTVGLALAAATGGRSDGSGWAELRSLRFAARRDLVIFTAVLVGAATAVGLQRAAITGLAASLAVWLRGWTETGGLGLGTALVSLVIYEPLLLVGGIYAAVARRKTSSLNRNLAAWAAGALLVALAYPSRTAADLAWCLVPLALLAGQSVADAVEQLVQAEHKPFLAILTGILLLLATFAYIQLSAYSRGIGRGPAFDPALELGLAIGALVLGLVIAVLFGLGWSWTLALNGVRVVAALLFCMASISALWSLNFTARAATARELWRPEATTNEARLLLDTAQGVSMAQTGWPDALPLRLEAQASPVLAWTLRAFPLDVPTDSRANDLPRVILRPKGAQDRALAADYVGQTFTLGERKAWSGILPSGLLDWLVKREAAVSPEQWLLLVRADVASFGEFPIQPAAPGPGS